MDWTNANRIALRAFVSANPQFIAELRRRTPKIEGTDFQHRAIVASEHKGAEDIIDAISALAEFEHQVSQPTPFVDTSND